MIFDNLKRKRESTDKIIRKEVWLDFHLQNLKHICYEVPNFAFNDKKKNEQSLKQQRHPYQKI